MPQKNCRCALKIMARATCRTGRHKTLCSMLVFLVEAGFFIRPQFFGENPPKHAEGPRGCTCRPRAPQRVGVRLWVRVGLGRRARLKLATTRPAQSFVPQSFVPTSPAHNQSLKTTLNRTMHPRYATFSVGAISRGGQPKRSVQ